MEHRLLGRDALKVSAIGLGCMSMSGTYGKSDDAGSIAVVHRALELGADLARHVRHVRLGAQRGARGACDPRLARLGVSSRPSSVVLRGTRRIVHRHLADRSPTSESRL